MVDVSLKKKRDPVGGEAIGNLHTGEGLPLDYRDLEMVAKTLDDTGHFGGWNHEIFWRVSLVYRVR